MKRYAWTLAVLAVAGLVAVSVQAGEEDEAALKARAAAWEKAFNGSEFEKVAAMYAQDGMRMPPNAETAKGRDAILAQLKESRAAMSGVELGVEGVVLDGALAVTSGTYKIKGPDGSVVDHGKWVSVGKKIEGEWTTLSDIWNSDRPLPVQ